MGQTASKRYRDPWRNACRPSQHRSKSKWKREAGSLADSFPDEPMSGWQFEEPLLSTIVKQDESSHSSADREFEEQKKAFLSIESSVLEQYCGQFVASLDGEIVDHDLVLASLTRRFFSKYGDVAVYIAKVGEPIQVTVTTPLLR